MSNEKSKDFNKMLNDNKNMPRVEIIKDKKTIERYGGEKMLLAPPIYYDKLMKKVPEGKLITVKMMREYLAKKNDADFTDPLTSGIFTSIVAWASSQRESDITPYWRTLKSDGELNPKYPGGVEMQKKYLESEGHKIVARGSKKIRYYVNNYEDNLVNLEKID